jgi:hypothetical protein
MQPLTVSSYFSSITLFEAKQADQKGNGKTERLLYSMTKLIKACATMAVEFD